MKARELRDLSAAELRQKELDLITELFNLKFQHATGQLENTERLPQVRKDLARVKTILGEKISAQDKGV
ncbi:MAG: 50S ribosomal protein L29 [Proteobacteria bacterium]|nr:50S ribosomal protein L29 [Pseudomonadota bacterium]